MAESANVLAFVIEVDPTSGKAKLKEFDQAVNKTADNAKKGGEQVHSLTKNISGIATAVSGAVGALAAFQGFRFIASAVSQFAEAEASAFKLQMAFKNQGEMTGEAAKAASDFADSLERVTGMDADLIREGQGLLVSLGSLKGQGLDRATEAALNLSRGIGMGLSEAFTLVAKAAAGSTATFARYGIVLDEGMSKQEKYEQVLKLVEQKWGGLAVQFGDTLPGQLEKLKTAWGNTMEKVGETALLAGANKALEIMDFLLTKVQKTLKEIDTGISQDPAQAMLDSWRKGAEDQSKSISELHRWYEQLDTLDLATFQATIDVVGTKMDGLTYVFERQTHGVDRLEEANRRAKTIQDEWFKGLKPDTPAKIKKNADAVYDFAAALNAWTESAKRASVDASLMKALGLDAGGKFPSTPLLPLQDKERGAQIPDMNQSIEPMAGGFDTATIAAWSFNDAMANLNARLADSQVTFGAVTAYASDLTATERALGSAVTATADAFGQLAAQQIMAYLAGEQGAKKALNAVAKQQMQSNLAMALSEIALGIASSTGWGAFLGPASNHFKAAAVFGSAAAAWGVLAKASGGFKNGGGGGGGKGGKQAKPDLPEENKVKPSEPAVRETKVTLYIAGQGFVQDYDAFTRELATNLQKELAKVGR